MGTVQKKGILVGLLRLISDRLFFFAYSFDTLVNAQHYSSQSISSIKSHSFLAYLYAHLVCGLLKYLLLWKIPLETLITAIKT